LNPTGGKINFPREILIFSNWFPDCGYFRIGSRIAVIFELVPGLRLFSNWFPDCGYFRIVSRIAVIFELFPGLRLFSNWFPDCGYFRIDTLLNRRIFSNCESSDCNFGFRIVTLKSRNIFELFPGLRNIFELLRPALNKPLGSLIKLDA
jgi:uncharacterized protein YggT (Ycf19 family)